MAAVAVPEIGKIEVAELEGGILESAVDKAALREGAGVKLLI
jgi:hypothetical protein